METGKLNSQRLPKTSKRTRGSGLATIINQTTLLLLPLTPSSTSEGLLLLLGLRKRLQESTLLFPVSEAQRMPSEPPRLQLIDPTLFSCKIMNFNLLMILIQ